MTWRMGLPVLLAAALCGCAAAQQAAAPGRLIDDATLRSRTAELLKQAHAAPDGVAFVNLVQQPDSLLQLCVRVKSGRAEWHRDDADMLILQEGEAEIVTGGTVVGGRETAPGEMRGDAVEGGRRQPFRAGEIIRIEPQTPHQFLLKPGTTVRYLAIKTHPGR